MIIRAENVLDYLSKLHIQKKNKETENLLKIFLLVG